MVQVKTPAAIAQSASASDPTVPAGIVSVNRTPAGSVDGPLFVIVIVYVVDVPAVTVAVPSVFVSTRSANDVTVLLLFAVLFASAGSFGDAAFTVAVFTYVPPGVVVLTVTFTVITHAAAPEAIDGRVHVTTLPDVAA